MHKKKIQALIAAGLLSVGVIGGTLAWFTSEDSVTNIFNTGAVDNPDVNGGVDVDEEFLGPDGEKITPNENGESIYPKPVLPGDKLTKKVWVDSEANYDQFVRARIEKSWKIGAHQGLKLSENGEPTVGTDGKLVKEKIKIKFTKANGEVTESDFQPPALTRGQEVTHYAKVTALVDSQYEEISIYTDDINRDKILPFGVEWKQLDYRKIQLEFSGNSFGTEPNKNTWYAPAGYNEAWTNANTKSGEWYYYNQILQEQGYVEDNPIVATDHTANILESVTFKAEDSAIDNIYKTLRFDVEIKAESVQASNNAAESLGWSKDVPVSNIKGYHVGATLENNGTK